MRAWAAPHLPALPGRGRRVRLHDTASRTWVETPAGDVASMYVCGITPYDATHLGHAATYVAFDVLNRVWRDAGATVRYVQNVTDVDDPLLERAARTGQDWMALAERETELFRTDMEALRVLPPEALVGAVEAMDEIAALADRLRAAGWAYQVEDDWYFPVGAAAHFGEVAGLDRAAMRALSAERGGDPERPGKKDPLDPLLWRAARPGEPSWPSPMGAGRPGWHVECVAIAANRLGSRLDVQGGGSDLAYPHHECGSAHAEVAFGAWPWASAHAHAGMIGLDGAKMSKSRGNLVLVSRLRAQGRHPAAVRLALLAGHYRADREWTDAMLTGAERRLARWRAATGRPMGPSGTALLEAVREALAADLDTPSALAAVDTWAASDGDDPRAPGLVADAVDALLGVTLNPTT